MSNGPISVTVVDEAALSLVVQPDATLTVVGLEAGPQGPQGPQGPSGAQGPPGLNSSAGFHYDQDVPASVWTITHPLNKHPSVAIVDSTGDEVYGSVRYLDNSTVQLTFAAPFSGSVDLN